MFKALVLGLLVLCAIPASAATYSVAWHNVMGDGGFPTTGTTFDIGSTNKSAACGSILQGDILVAEVSINGSVDPGQPSTPTGFTAAPAGGNNGWTSLGGTSNTFRSSVFYQVVDAGHAGETCSFTSTWSSAASNGLSWVLVDLRPSGGTPPGTTIDSENSQTYHDNSIGNSAEAPSVTLSNSGDFYITFYAEQDGTYQLTPPGSQTQICDTFSEGGTFFSLETLCAFDTTPPSSGVTGTRTASYSNAFEFFINGSIGFNQPTSGGGVTTRGPVLGVMH